MNWGRFRGRAGLAVGRTAFSGSRTTKTDNSPDHLETGTMPISPSPIGHIDVEHWLGRYEQKMALEKELETYNAKLPELKENEGKFVLIQGDTVVNVYTSYEDAVKAGYKQFGLTPFLVKQIQTIEQAQFISRFVDPRTMRRV